MCPLRPDGRALSGEDTGPCGGHASLWVRPPCRGLCSQSRGKAGETRAPRGPACGLADLRDRALRLCEGRGCTLLARRGASRPEERRELLVEDEPLLEEPWGWKVTTCTACPPIWGHSAVRKVFLPPAETLLPGVSSGHGPVPFHTAPGRHLPTPGLALAFQPAPTPLVPLRHLGVSLQAQSKPPAPRSLGLEVLHGRDTCRWLSIQTPGHRHSLLEVAENQPPEGSRASGSLWQEGVACSPSATLFSGHLVLLVCNSSSWIKVPPRLIN